MPEPKRGVLWRLHDLVDGLVARALPYVLNALLLLFCGVKEAAVPPPAKKNERACQSVLLQRSKAACPGP